MKQPLHASAPPPGRGRSWSAAPKFVTMAWLLDVGDVIVGAANGFTVVSTTFVSSTQLTVQVTARNGAGFRGTYNLTVTNPDGGTATSVGSIVNQ